MTPQQQGCSYWGKGRHPLNKRSLSCRSDEPAPPQRRLHFLGWTFQPVWAVLRQSCEQQVRVVASILYNTNIRRSMTTVWFGIQISPVKAWRSHGKHDSRLYTSSSRFRQKKNDCWVTHNVSFFKWPGGPGQVFNAVYDYITIPKQTQIKTSWDLPFYIQHFFSLFPCGGKYSEWWTLTLARLMRLRENYSNFPLKRTEWIHSKVAYRLPVRVPPSNIGEIPCV